eukprot:203113-Pyramimonas_sp.AAC.1
MGAVLALSGHAENVFIRLNIRGWTKPSLAKRGSVKTTSGPNLAGASLANDGRRTLSRTESGQLTNLRVRVGVLSTP